MVVYLNAILIHSLWYYTRFSQITSPKSSHRADTSMLKSIESRGSRGSLSPSIHSSEGRPLSRGISRPQSQPSRSGGKLTTIVVPF